MPDDLFALMSGKAVEAGKVFIMATVGEDGWCHPAMGSYYELVAKSPGRIHLAVGKNSTTERNLARTGQLTLVVTDHGLNYYLKGTARRTREQLDDTPFALFQVELETVLEDQEQGVTIVSGVRYELNQGGNTDFMQKMLKTTCEALSASPWEE
jgi:hypothetical protein